MHLDRSELQLLLLAARTAAWSARAEQERARLPRLASAEAYERLAARLETELVRAGAAAPNAGRPNAGAQTTTQATTRTTAQPSVPTTAERSPERSFEDPLPL